ncbi:MAG: hypothetical protein AB8H03_07385 [Saprospiraceae bacterium]
MKNIMRFFLFVVFLSFSSLSMAQQESLSSSIPFFEKKIKNYQRWLDTVGLGQIIMVDFVRLQPEDDKTLEMVLKMRTTNSDLAINQWRSLEKNHPHQTGFIENQLFRMFLHMMEITGDQGNIQIYVKNKNDQLDACFYIGIWEESIGIFKSEKTLGCKSKPIPDIILNPIKTSNLIECEEAEIITNQNPSSSEVFDIIINFIQKKIIENKKYYNGTCSNRSPYIERGIRKTDTHLIFSISDLCREVLHEEDNSMLCSLSNFFGSPCNDKARERLTFTFEYIKFEDKVKLKGIIEGKFGSGTFKPRTEGYMDMEPDFNIHLETYANEIYNQLIQILNQ